MCNILPEASGKLPDVYPRSFYARGIKNRCILIEVQNLGNEALEIEGYGQSGGRVYIHLLLEGRLGLPGSGIYAQGAPVFGNSHDMDMPGMQYLGKRVYDEIILAARCDGRPFPVTRRKMAPLKHTDHHRCGFLVRRTRDHADHVVDGAPMVHLYTDALEIYNSRVFDEYAVFWKFFREFRWNDRLRFGIPDHVVVPWRDDDL